MNNKPPHVKTCSPSKIQNPSWLTLQSPHKEICEFLSSVLVAVDKLYYVKDSTSGRWIRIEKESLAISQAFQNYNQPINVNGLTIVLTLSDIKMYIKNFVRYLDDTTYAPLCDDFVTFKHENRLNIYIDRRVKADIDCIAVDGLEELLKIIRNGCCGAEDELSYVEMIDEILSDKPTEFRWVMHWLAIPYKYPGMTTQTNLWLIGARGVGKGTLVGAMRRLLGDVNTLQKDEIAKGWFDTMFGCTLLEWDEFKAEGWYDFNNMIKKQTGNETVQITSRNKQAKTHPAVCQHIFTTNEDTPLYVSSDDRQNTFVQTAKEGSIWIERAKQFNMSKTLDDKDVIKGFGALLDQIEIDEDFVFHPLMTPMRQKFVEKFADDSITMWYESDPNFYGSKPTWEEMHKSYVDYCRSHLHVKSYDIKKFKSDAKDKGYAIETVSKDDNGKSFRRPVFRTQNELKSDNILQLKGIKR